MNRLVDFVRWLKAYVCYVGVANHEEGLQCLTESLIRGR